MEGMKILGFWVLEQVLLLSPELPIAAVPVLSCSEIDKTLENMSSYRKNKWIIEGRLRRWAPFAASPPSLPPPALWGWTRCPPGCGVGRGTGTQHLPLCPRRLKVALAKRTGRSESEMTGLEDGRRRRSSRLTEDVGLDLEEEEETRGRKSRREEEVRCSGLCRAGGSRGWGSLPLSDPSSLAQVDTSTSSVPELERQIEKLAKVSGAGNLGVQPCWRGCSPLTTLSPHRGRCSSVRSCSIPPKPCVQPRWARTGSGGAIGSCPTWAASSWRALKVSEERAFLGGYSSWERTPHLIFSSRHSS